MTDTPKAKEDYVEWDWEAWRNRVIERLIVENFTGDEVEDEEPDAGKGAA
jgi:hypothetical protein